MHLPDIVDSDKAEAGGFRLSCGSRPWPGAIALAADRIRTGISFLDFIRARLRNCNFLHSPRISPPYLDSLIWLTMVSGMHGKEVPAHHPTIGPVCSRPIIPPKVMGRTLFRRSSEIFPGIRWSALKSYFKHCAPNRAR